MEPLNKGHTGIKFTVLWGGGAIIISEVKGFIFSYPLYRSCPYFREFFIKGSIVLWIMVILTHVIRC